MSSTNYIATRPHTVFPPGRKSSRDSYRQVERRYNHEHQSGERDRQRRALRGLSALSLPPVSHQEPPALVDWRHLSAEIQRSKWPDRTVDDADRMSYRGK